jgi:hypothetical protein
VKLIEMESIVERNDKNSNIQLQQFTMINSAVSAKTTSENGIILPTKRYF